MTDHFALLGESRRPSLDAERLKARFHALTAMHHPDVAPAGEGSPDFSSLNVAYQVLSDPRARLRHLLELEAPGSLARHQAVPPAIGELFAGMGARKQALDAFQKKRAGAGSALARAMLMSEQLLLQEDLEAWLAVLEGEKAVWLDRIAALDADWPEAQKRERTLARISETVQALGYLDKWSAQIREGVVRLHLD